MKGIQRNTGIHTFSVGMTLTGEQYYRIMDRLYQDFQHRKTDFWDEEKHYVSNVLKEKGIDIYLSKNKTGIYHLKIRIEPCRVLQNESPAALYVPSKKSYCAIVKRMDELLQPYGIPRSIDNMKINRADLTCDLYFPEPDPVRIYMRFLKKSFVIPRYQRDFFHAKEKKVKNISEANERSCKQQCKTAAFFAYDKISQLKMIGRLTDELKNAYILRLEAELKREALKKHLGKIESNYQLLKKGAKKVHIVIGWYLKRIFKGNTGAHYPYKEAIRRIQEQKWKDKTKERAVYLLRKISDSNSMNAAIDKTKENFGLKTSAITHLLKKLEKAGIHPVTLPNTSSKYERVENLQRIVAGKDISIDEDDIICRSVGNM